MRAWSRGAAARAAVVAGWVLAAPVALAVPDEAGDAVDGEADHDILDVTFSETALALRFTVQVAGAVRAPAPGVDEMRIRFALVPPEARVEGLSPQPLGTRFSVQPSTAGPYGVFREGAFGHVLPAQPASGAAAATWEVPKAYLDALGLRRPAAGDWVADVVVSTVALGATMDVASHPGARLTRDEPAGVQLHLRGDLAGPRTLSREAPAEGDAVPAADPLFDGILVGEWTSAPLARRLALGPMGAFLWLSASTTSPVVADEELWVDVFAQDALGQRTLLARRAEALSEVPGATTNLFLVPGAPQRLPLELAAVPGASQVPAGSAVVLQVRVGGFLAEESGPIVVYFDSDLHDSFLALGRAHVPRAHAACTAEPGQGAPTPGLASARCA